MSEEVSAAVARGQHGIWLPLWIIDACKGDMNAARMLAQLLYWLAPDGKGKTRARMVDDGGNVCLARRHDEWWDECRLTEDQAKRASATLKALRLVDVDHRRFDGFRIAHYTLRSGEIAAAVSAEVHRPGSALLHPPVSAEVHRPLYIQKERTTEITKKGSGGDASQGRNGASARQPRKAAPPSASATGPLADVGRALARIRGLNPDVCAESDRQPLRDLAEIIVGAGVEDPATVSTWGRQWYASMAKRLQRPVAEIEPPTVGQLTTFIGTRLPRKADSSAPAILDEDAIRARWPGLTFIAPNGRLSVKSPHALACEGKVEKDSYDYLDRSTWPADVRECVAAVAALHGQAVGR